MSAPRAILGLCLGLILAVGSVSHASSEEAPKVVILGFDGADARLVERWMDQGDLPNLDRLRREGFFAPRVRSAQNDRVCI